MHAHPVKGGVARFRPQSFAVHDKGGTIVEQYQISGGTCGQPATGQAKTFGRIKGQRTPQGGDIHHLGMHQTQGGRQQSLKTDGTGCGFLEGQAFGFLVLRGVHGTDDVNQARCHGFDHGDAVVFVAQRGLELEERPVVGHIKRVQSQVVDAHTCGNIQPVLFCTLKRGQGAGGGDLVGVIAGTGHFNQGDVAVQPHAFGHGRYRGQSAQGCEFAGSCSGTLAQDRFLGVGDDQRAQTARIGQRAREHFGVGDHAVTIGKSNCACIHEKTDLGHLVAFAAFGQGGHGDNIDRRCLVCASGDKFQHFGAVDGRIGIGAGDHRGDTACRCRQPGGAKAFLVTFARLANLDAQIDNAGGQIFAATIDNRTVCRNGRIFGQDRRDLTAFDPQGATGHGPCFGVNQFRVHKVQHDVVIFHKRLNRRSIPSLPRHQRRRAGQQWRRDRTFSDQVWVLSQQPP